MLNSRMGRCLRQSCWCTCLLAGTTLLSVAGEGPAAAVEEAADAPPATTADREQRLAERDPLRNEALRLLQDGDAAGAEERARAVLAIEREVLGDDDAELIGTLDLIAQCQTKREAWDDALHTREDLVARSIAAYGEIDYRVIDARLALQHVQLLRGLTPDERRELTDSAVQNREGIRHYREGRYAEATQIAEQVLQTRRRILGERHPDYATSLYNLAYLYFDQGDAARAEPMYQQALEIQQEVLGERHPAYARSLNNLAYLYSEQGDTARAEALYLQASEIWKEVLGERHPDYATSLNNLALLYQNQGDTARAEPLYRQALEIIKEVLGERHPAYTSSLNNLATLYDDQADYARAEPLYRQASEITKEVLGERHPDYATSLNNLAYLYDAQGDYAQAEPLFRQASEIWKEALGEQHPDYATSLHNLAALYHEQGDTARAEPLYRQALEIRKEVLGERHPDYASSLNNLANLYRKQGDYARAEPLCRQALEITKEVLGERHPDYATSLDVLAALYDDQADYVRAEPLYRQASEIWKEVLGIGHPLYAQSLNNLAALYEAQGDYARAEPLYRQALEITKDVFGERHPDYATSLNNLALLYYGQRDTARAEPLFLQASEITKEILGERHPHYASSLNNLALLYARQGDSARAEPLYRQASEIMKDVLGEQHPDYATSLDNLASLYDAEGDYARAEPLYREALEIRKEALGERHPDYARSLLDIALLLSDLGSAGDGLLLSQTAVEISAAMLEATAAVQSERQQLLMARNVDVYADGLLSLAHLTDAAADDFYSSLFGSKGQVLVRQRAIRELRVQTAQTPDSPAAQTFAVLADRARELDRLAKLAPAPDELDAHRLQLEELTLDVERLQQTLATLSAEYRQSEQAIALTPSALAARLPGGVALIDLREYDQYLPHDAEHPAGRWDRHYAAFIVRNNQPVHVVWLGAAEPIDSAVVDWQRHLGTGLSIEAGRELRRLVWEPLEAFLDGVTTVQVSPDGALNVIPFGALPGSVPETYLIEERAFVTVPAPLLLPEILDRTADLDDDPSLLAVGDVDYGADPGALQVATKDFGAIAARGGDGLSSWQRLPDSRVEVQTIEETFVRSFAGAPANSLRRAAATEQAFRMQAPRARYLHLATHGYFAPEELQSVLAVSRTEEDTIGLFAREDVGGWNPGLLSGIVLAGANQPADPERDDGVLTALEVAELDLSGVELVALSACETGLGKTAGGEGVLGLQRSFQLAGARTTLASLWQVPDAATRALMVEFYQNLWQKRLPRSEALRQAQLMMLRGGADRSLASRGVDPVHVEEDDQVPPYYWAAFVLSGDWR